MGKLPKSEAWKWSDPDRLGLLLHPRYSGRSSLSESIGFRQSFHTKQTRANKLCQTPKDSSRASALELRGGLLIGREVLLLSEPRHSPNKAMPCYYTKIESFASGISKVWCVCYDFH
jgi:hypothetical protein